MDQEPSAQLQRLQRKLAGDGPIQKQIILLKLTDLYKNRPDFQYGVSAGSPQREWLSAVGALIKRYDKILAGTTFDVKMMILNKVGTTDEIVGLVFDVIAAIKLELELDGRSEIGTVYRPGEVYKFYADLKDIIANASKEIFLIDAYLTGQAFNEYFGAVGQVELRLLVSRSGTEIVEIKNYADRHSRQYQTRIEIRKTKEIHDRLIIADQGDSWVIGGSLNQTGDRPTYLLPLTPGIATQARDLYSEIWDRARPVE